MINCDIKLFQYYLEINVNNNDSYFNTLRISIYLNETYAIDLEVNNNIDEHYELYQYKKYILNGAAGKSSEVYKQYK